MNITVPNSIDDCSPGQLAKWIFLSDGIESFDSLMQQLDFQVQVVSIFSGLSKERICQYSPDQVITVFNHLMNILSDHKQSEPIGTVEINGNKYVFDKEFKNYNTGAIIDLKLIESVYDDPYKVLSILYVEEGMTYNQIDENDNVLNPSIVRKKLFRESFPGAEFLNVFAFFLDYYTKRNDATFALKMATAQVIAINQKNELKKEIKTLNGTYGRKT
tara:strand:+ start:9209 stop:9859 length:651 start_codon:yes stop_codon:yes gene_type:complete